MRGSLYASLLGAKTSEEVTAALATALREGYPNAIPATRARDLCLYCKADTTDARGVNGNCYSCGSV